MNNKDPKSIASYINRIIASNNPQVAVSVLKKYGYQTQYDSIPADQIEGALMRLYLSDYKNYINAIRSVPYRQDITNWTTSVQTKDQIRQKARDLGMADSSASKTSLDSVIDWIKGAITSTTTVAGGGGTVIQESAVPASIILLITVLGIGAILFLVLKFGKTA